MFISKHRLNKLERRIKDLENNIQYTYGYEEKTQYCDYSSFGTWSTPYPKKIKMQLVIEQVLDSLGLEVKRIPPKSESFKLAKKKKK